MDDSRDDGHFVVTSTEPKNTNSTDSPKNATVGFACMAPNEDLRNQWVKTLRDILQTQRDFLRAIQSPIAYQKGKTKESWVSGKLAYLDLGG